MFWGFKSKLKWSKWFSTFCHILKVKQSFIKSGIAEACIIFIYLYNFTFLTVYMGCLKKNGQEHFEKGQIRVWTLLYFIKYLAWITCFYANEIKAFYKQYCFCNIVTTAMEIDFDKNIK